MAGASLMPCREKLSFAKTSAGSVSNKGKFSPFMDHVNLSTIDIVVMVIYLAAIVGWGFWHGSRSSAEGYFLGGRGMPWMVVGLSMFSTLVSSAALVGWAGDAYGTGISVFNRSEEQ